jgi:hypothetical protein
MKIGIQKNRKEKDEINPISFIDFFAREDLELL